MLSKSHVAGLSFSGGKKDNFYFSVLEYYTKEKRWFLSRLHHVQENQQEGNQSIINWISDYNLKNLTVDFPNSRPHCEDCKLECPGADLCIDEEVVRVRKIISSSLIEDQKKYLENPKEYERKREKEKLIDFSSDQNLFIDNIILEKRLKNKLKKGYSPYWNRPIDLWISLNYHSLLMKYFKTSYDSFTRSSVMLNYRFGYLKRHIPKDVMINESNAYVILLELYRHKVISQKDLREFSIFDTKIDSKKRIIKNIEKKLKVFIYDKDMDLLLKQPKAFESFLLSVVSQRQFLDDLQELPIWALRKNEKYLIPRFMY